MLRLMDREQHLAQAEAHVELGEMLVQMQRDIVAEIQRNGGDVAAARVQLRRFEGMQALNVADWHRLSIEPGTG
jgi:hypothetical protein